MQYQIFSIVFHIDFMKVQIQDDIKNFTNEGFYCKNESGYKVVPKTIFSVTSNHFQKRKFETIESIKYALLKTYFKNLTKDDFSKIACNYRKEKPISTKILSYLS